MFIFPVDKRVPTLFIPHLLTLYPTWSQRMKLLIKELIKQRRVVAYTVLYMQLNLSQHGGKSTEKKN